VRVHDPLARSGVYQAATGHERRAAHRALAAALTDDPDRQAWHQAAAAHGHACRLKEDIARAKDRLIPTLDLEEHAAFEDAPEDRSVVHIPASGLSSQDPNPPGLGALARHGARQPRVEHHLSRHRLRRGRHGVHQTYPFMVIIEEELTVFPRLGNVAEFAP